MKTYERYIITYKDGSTITAATTGWLLGLVNRRSIKKVEIIEVDEFWNERKIRTLHTKKEIREFVRAKDRIE